MARPSIINEALIAKFCSFLRISASIRTAISATGIARESYYGWARKVRQGGGSKLERKFMAAVEQAEGETKLIHERMLRQHFDTNWRAAAWWLERMYPQEYGLRRLPVPLRTAAANGDFLATGTVAPAGQSGTHRVRHQTRACFGRMGPWHLLRHAWSRTDHGPLSEDRRRPPRRTAGSGYHGLLLGAPIWTRSEINWPEPADRGGSGDHRRRESY